MSDFPSFPLCRGKQRVKKQKPSRNYSDLLQFEVQKPTASTSSPVFLPYVRTDTSGFVLNPYHRVEMKGTWHPEGLRSVHSLDWTSVARVTQLAEDPAACPICLDREKSCSVAGECGHAYCLLCALQLLTRDAKCAVCSRNFPLSSLRPFDFLPITRIAPSASACFRLMRKEKTGTASVFPCGEPCASGFPDSRFRVFNRITMEIDANRQFFDEVTAILDRESREDMRKLMNRLLESLRSEEEVGKSMEIVPEPASDHTLFYYFYQAADGQPYFLSDLTDRILISQYKYRSKFPHFLQCPVLDVMPVVLSAEILKDHRFLRHFSVGETVNFVDLDVSSVVSAEVLEEFRAELREKEDKRRQKQRKDAVALRVAKNLREPLAAPLSVCRFDDLL